MRKAAAYDLVGTLLWYDELSETTTQGIPDVISSMLEEVMRFLVQVTMPHEPFNSYVKDGTSSAKMKRILDELKPEAAYFVEIGGCRTGILVTNLNNSSEI